MVPHFFDPPGKLHRGRIDLVIDYFFFFLNFLIILLRQVL